MIIIKSLLSLEYKLNIKTVVGTRKDLEVSIINKFYSFYNFTYNNFACFHKIKYDNF